MRAVFQRFGVLVVAVAAALSGSTLSAQDEDMVNELSQFYGFKPLELVKLSDRSGNLVSGDFNHDGITDLAIADNAHSRIDLLLQRGGNRRTLRPARSRSITSRRIGGLSIASSASITKSPRWRSVISTTMG